MGLLGKLVSDVGTRLTSGRATTTDDVRLMLDRGEVDAASDAVERLVPGTADRDFVVEVLRGEIAFRRHEDEQAESWFRAALRRRPGAPEAHYGLSALLLARGDAELALRHAQFAARGLNAARMHAQLGLCYVDLGNAEAALQPLKRAVRLDERDAPSWCNLGICYYVLGKVVRAEECCRRALEIRPGYAKAIEILATLTKVPEGRASNTPDADHADAIKSIDQLRAEIDAAEARGLAAPDDAEVALRLAALYEESSDLDSAVNVAQTFLSRHPGAIRVAGELGKMYVDACEFTRAEPHVVAALEVFPDDPELLRGRAEIHLNRNQLSVAVPLLRRASDLAPSLATRGRLAAALDGACMYDESLVVARSLQDEGVSSASLTTVMVDALIGLGRHDEALTILDEALKIRPFAPGFRTLRGVTLLSQEKFGPGWDDYFYRNLAVTEHLRVMPFPIWKGEPLTGKTIVVAAEQGLGDQVMFASCLPDVLAYEPGRVIVECIDRVAPTIARSFPQCEVVSTNQDRHMTWLTKVGHVDYFVLIGDLPMLFRRARKDFPQHRGYLVPDAGRKQHWITQLSVLGGSRPRIGISWRGGTEQTRAALRTAQVLDFVGLAEGIDATWVCLQYGNVDADLETARGLGLDMAYWPSAIKDLDEFAALIAGLDLVLTVCNTTVHYAGAQDVPVWVLSPKCPEWRYGLTQESLPWYPSSRIYRHDEPGQWGPLFARVKRRLRDHFHASS